MYIPFRQFHLLKFLKEYEQLKLPLDISLHLYFKKQKQLGSKDRRFIANTSFNIIRWQALLDFYEKVPSWESRLKKILSMDCFSFSPSEEVPEHIRVSFPKHYYEWIRKSYGSAKSQNICLICNEQAPITVRVNSLKINRDALYEKWKKRFPLQKTKSPYGLIFKDRISLFSLEEFKQGYFEMQDEGSQMLAALIDAKKKEKILDYCSGSGGKTLAFAPLMQNTGQIYLHDLRKSALFQAKKRLKRAGIQNAQILSYDSSYKKKLRLQMDKVVVDAPCSGSGTLRRNPDMKWRLSPKDLENLIVTQRTIFKEALDYVKPKGFIYYMTCSLFVEENQKQMHYFQENLSVRLIKTSFWLPESQGKDGFFAAVFEKK